MSIPMVAIEDVAPAVAFKPKNIKPNDDVWHLGLEHIESNSGRLISTRLQRFDDIGSSTHWFDESNVLYSKLRPNLNKVYVPQSSGVATTELIPLQPDPRHLDKSYLAYYLRSSNFLSWVTTRTTGAKMPRADMKLFWRHKIPLPPLPEQKRIAAILDAADALRQKDQQLIDHYTALGQSLFLEMFGDPISNSKGFKECRISDISSKIQIGPFGSQLHKRDYVSGGVPLVNPMHISDGKLVTDTNFSLTEEKYNSLENYHLKEGDIVMGRRGEMGRCAIVPNVDKLFCGTGSMFMRLTEKCHPLYLLFALRSVSAVDYLERNAQGVTMKNLNKKIVSEMKVGLPELTLQLAFARSIKLLEEERIRAGLQINKSNSLFECLLHQAFSGNTVKRDAT